MIIILGSLTATPATIDELMQLGLEHTRRSRLEPGCLSHDVSRDVENPDRLLFVERWADMDAVRTHFAVKASGNFVRRAIAMADAPPTLELFDASITTA
jgi:quinol monooxygenase YgiN